MCTTAKEKKFRKFSYRCFHRKNIVLDNYDGRFTKLFVEKLISQAADIFSFHYNQQMTQAHSSARIWRERCIFNAVNLIPHVRSMTTTARPVVGEITIARR